MSRSLVLFLLFSLSCTRSEGPSGLASSSQPSHLALHDIAIMMPYHQHPMLMDLSPALTEGADAFLPAGSIQMLAKQLEETRDASFFENLSQFKMISIRIDPCSNALSVRDKIKDCRSQFRIVWQVVRPGPQGVLGQDTNLHTIYSLTTEDLSKILLELKTLKAAAGVDYSLEPLGPHPLLLKEGNGAFLQGIQGLVKTYAKAGKLTQLAAMTNNFSDDHWDFTALEVKNGRISAAPLPQVSADANGRFPSFISVGMNIGSFSEILPSPQTKPSIFEGSPSEVFDNTFVINDPRRHDLSNTDCGSCHLADNRRTQMLEGNESRFKLPSDRFTSQKWNLEIKPEFAKHDDVFQLFGLIGASYIVSQRVINETAASLDWIESHQLAE